MSIHKSETLLSSRVAFYIIIIIIIIYVLFEIKQKFSEDYRACISYEISNTIQWRSF